MALKVMMLKSLIKVATENRNFTFSGALFAGNSRIVSINGMSIEAEDF